MEETRTMATMSGTEMQEQRMTSLDIAAVTGKTHAHVLRDIRIMEPAWEEVHGTKFGLMQIRLELPNGGYRLIPAFSLTKLECLFISTRFNDVARAKLVKRWYQLECEKLGVKEPEQKLLVTDQEIVKRSDEIRRDQIADANADADGCYSASDIAHMMQMSVKELNKQLVDAGLQFWNGGRYKLTKKYEESGFAKDRSFHYFGLDGEKKERFYLVWTPEGADYIRRMVNG